MTVAGARVPEEPESPTDGRGTLRVGDVEIAYRVCGVGDSIVLVHSGTSSGEFDWRRQVPVLAERYRVIVPDLRGHGRSSDGPITLAALTADLDALCRHLDAYPAHLLGASHGSFPVLELALEVSGAARSVALVGSVWRDDDPFYEHEATLFANWPQALRRLHQRHGSGHWAELLRRLLADRRANVRFTEADFARVPCPLLVVQGDRDPLLDVSVSAAAAAAAPDGGLLVLPGVGHAAYIEAPQLFNAAYLTFLDRVEGAATIT